MKHLIAVIPMLLLTMTFLVMSANSQPINNLHQINKIKVGAEQPELYLPLLKDKRVGLVVNQTSRVGDLHLVDYLLSQHVDIKFIFAPEHGFRGDHDAGANVASSIDKKTGISLFSLYGTNRKPPAEIMAKLDLIIFDIQDVGVRYYTYISTMHYVMAAAADAEVSFMVLDRPNPNIFIVDGPMLTPKFRSFVGMDEIPLMHGMTVGELAQMIKGEGWLNSKHNLDLTVIPVANYNRSMNYWLPIKPSPNLPNQTAVQLYPMLAFFEATPVSVGRGTPFPFQVIGHDMVKLGHFEFTPVSMVGAALVPKLMNKKLYGRDFRGSKQVGLNLSYFYSAYQQFKNAGVKFFQRPTFLDKLAGTDEFRKALQAGKSLLEIRASWQPALKAFNKQRKPYLIY